MSKERSDKEFKAAMFEATRHAIPVGQTYSSFLILPVQRMASVINAVKHLDKFTADSHIDKEHIEKAEVELEQAAATVDRVSLHFKEPRPEQ